MQSVLQSLIRRDTESTLRERIRRGCPPLPTKMLIYIANNLNIITKMDLIKIAEEAFATPKKDFESFAPGDTVTVAYRIKEGNKERIQQYRGVVIKINGQGDKKRFTVRKISDGIGVERIFPMESPFIESITVMKHGKVRRAKLYYLRALTGKKARIKERYVKKNKEEK